MRAEKELSTKAVNVSVGGTKWPGFVFKFYCHLTSSPPKTAPKSRLGTAGKRSHVPDKL